MMKVEGYIWCDLHGTVHEDTTNPYISDGDKCNRKFWRVLSMEDDDA
jgi:hypothetical protein